MLRVVHATNERMWLMGVNVSMLRGFAALLFWASCAAVAVGGQRDLGTLIPPAATLRQGTPTVKIA
jgi:hypothetical protein